MIVETNNHPQYNLNKINISIAHFLKTLYPSAHVYFGTNQQEVEYPCFYITYPTEPERQKMIGGTGLVTLNVCLVYEKDANELEQGIEQDYIEVAANLDENINNLTYVRYNDDFTEILKEIPMGIPGDPKYKWDTTALWYYFTLKLRTIDTNADVKIETFNRDITADYH